MRTMVIQIRSGTMMNMDTNIAVKLARAALDKGYGVRMFGYGEGVTLIKKGQDPKRFPNVGNETKELVEKGLEVVVCETCCKARGIARGEEIEGTKIGSLTNDLSRFVAEGDRMVTLAR
ncbi:MAG TPA: DsrE family protein [Methanomassiliicoccales archaeon]|jgi:sulfur relay (sulfurtransferase) complex TusBCD TusD component (DsrE family)|nr:DsrE family protein [Euryarchaeota archaeon]HOE53183.1 DsrE family protein [Methanomassiliicoccales archaeon]HOO04767.1 DsrE family protein [Methanomassiliicoccales archaeon]HPD09037.1 DsrE family protein [Methanomassiliicoccales archaeon]HQM67450.1 DsrE family protein [Methanomassiliicoccales archaeon]